MCYRGTFLAIKRIIGAYLKWLLHPVLIHWKYGKKRGHSTAPCSHDHLSSSWQPSFTFTLFALPFLLSYLEKRVENGKASRERHWILCARACVCVDLIRVCWRCEGCKGIKRGGGWVARMAVGAEWVCVPPPAGGLNRAPVTWPLAIDSLRIHRLCPTLVLSLAGSTS